MQIQDRDSGQYLQDDGNTWTTHVATNDASTPRSTPGTGTTRTWHVPGNAVTTNRNLLVSAQAFTAATGGTGDSTKATKKFESFSTDDQTPTTSITGPSGIQTSTTFTMTGTATDDKGVNSLSYWFRDDQERYLQDDGTRRRRSSTRFRGTPDVIGATNATWSYDVTLPHEGVWRGSATATDTTGQADLRSATRDWTIDSNAVAPTVTIEPAGRDDASVRGARRSPWSPAAGSPSPAPPSDDEGLKNVEISLRNSSHRGGPRQRLQLGHRRSRHGNCRISPVDISGSNYNWT